MSLVIICCPAIVATAQTTYPVTGTVLGPSGPLAGAAVRIQGLDHFQSKVLVNVQQTTDATGGFSAQIPEGYATVSVNPPAGSGLLPDFSGNIAVPPGVDFRFTLVRPIKLSMRAVAADGQSVAVRFDIYSLSSDRSFTVGGGAGQSATINVPTDRYAIHAIPADTIRYSTGRLNVDARNGDLQNLIVTVPINDGTPLLTQRPPKVSLIHVSAADADGVATVSGAAGAVEPSSSVAVVNLLTHQTNLTVSELDGSFALPMFAPPGSYLQIKHDPTGRFLPHMNFGAGGNNEFEVAAGTILYVPPEGNSSQTIATGFEAGSAFNADLRYRALSLAGASDPGQAWINASFTQQNWRPGGRISAQGTLVYYSTNLSDSTDLSAMQLKGNVSIEKIIDSTGHQLQQPPFQKFMSSVVTPTGFPIERFGWGAFVGSWTASKPRRVAANRVEFDWSLTANLPANLESGTYRLQLSIWNFAGHPTGGYHLNTFPSPESPEGLIGGALPVIRIGNPAASHLTWALGLNDFSNGSRGAIAVEDRGKFQFASHVKTNTDQFIIPMRDARTGVPLRYRLEPFVPLMGASHGRIGAVPQIPFAFPSGNLSVSVIHPDGAREDLGSAPFIQDTSRTPTTTGGAPVNGASSHPSDLYELTTGDSRFQYTFKQYGTYQVIMKGTIQDIFGNVYDGGGTYEVIVARTLSIDTAVVTGTPFQVGDVFSPVVHVFPGVPAQVDIRVRLLPNSDPSQTVEHHIQGTANRFGYFNPKLGQPIQMTTPGEYRVDVTAQYTDDQGTIWEGAVTWGSVVETPNSPIVTKGRRGFDLTNYIQQQWFRVRDVRTGGDHVMFPFHSGDVMWMQKDDPAAGIPKISLQDTTGSLAARIRQLSQLTADAMETPSLTERIAAGEIPLFSTSSTRVSPSFDPKAVTQWGYYYGFAERPGIHVREFVSEDYSNQGYWRFMDDYNFQVGNGIGGDLPNDFKFQFGGAVFRSPADNFFYYGAYASLFVILPFNDAVGGRIFPPFQGNGGGPSGGPIMSLKGKDIDIFFHPTGTRPGSILEVGDTASFSGQIGPTLPGKVTITITSPSGLVRQIASQANRIGYFYAPATDFVVNEAGRYAVKVLVFYDGSTSAGKVSAPYPNGDVLGSDAGQFDFYVVSPSSSPVSVNLPRDAFRRPAFEKIDIPVKPDSTIQNPQMRYTLVMPGFILQQGGGTNLTYTYDANSLHKDFPNLDLTDSDGFTGQDVVTFSVLVSGTDPSGNTVYQARQVLLAGEELLALPLGVRSFVVSDRGALALNSTSTAGAVQQGYARIRPDSSATPPSGLAIFGSRNNGVLVSETAVPAAAPLTSGRIYAEIAGRVNTGFALVNPNNSAITFTFYYTDGSGTDSASNSIQISANSQKVQFLSESPFNTFAGSTFQGTFSFTATQPVGIVALRTYTNESGDFLMSTLPIIDTRTAALTATAVLPYYADGGGWRTEVLLVNPSDSALSGTLQFPNDVTIGTQLGRSFTFSIARRSSQKIATSGLPADVSVGAVRLTAANGDALPIPLAVFSYQPSGVVITQAAVPAVSGSVFRMYAESSGAQGQPGSISTGIAIANNLNADTSLKFELTNLDGSTTSLPAPVTMNLSGFGNARFLGEVFPGLPDGFKGVLRISTPSAGISVVGLRSRYNERTSPNNFLITTTAPTVETSSPPSGDLLLPLLVTGGGYTTQFVVYSGNPGPSSGTMYFFASNGSVLTIPLN